MEQLLNNMQKQKIEKNYLVSSYPNRGITFVGGDGAYLINEKGEKYLDLGSNYGVSIFGYSNKYIKSELIKQIYKLINLHGSFNNNIRSKVAELLLKRCGGKLAKVFFSNSGTEAIETAIKFARLKTGKSHFISTKGAYHGKTLGALSATSGDKYRKPFVPLLWNFAQVKFGDLNDLKSHISEKTAAVIIEPVQGEGGINIPPENYLKSVEKICREKNILLIVDEIQTGVGRIGEFLACQKFDIEPDILCLGKGLAGGIPIGATLISESIATAIPLQIHTSTFGGNPLACRGIIAVLAQLNKKRLDYVQEIGKYFLRKLQKIKHSKVIDIRGIGLMIAIEFKDNVTPILKALQRQQIIAIPAGSNIVRFLPPFIISKREVDRAVSVINKVIAEI